MCMDFLGGKYGGRTFSTWPDPIRSWRQLGEWRGSLWTFHLNPREMCHGISLLNCLRRQRRHAVLSLFFIIWVKNNHFTTTHIGGSERAPGLYSQLSLRPLVLAHHGWHVATTSYLFLYFSKFNLELRINQVENVEYQLVKYFIHYYQLRILIFVKKKI